MVYLTLLLLSLVTVSGQRYYCQEYPNALAYQNPSNDISSIVSTCEIGVKCNVYIRKALNSNDVDIINFNCNDDWTDDCPEILEKASSSISENGDILVNMKECEYTEKFIIITIENSSYNIIAWIVDNIHNYGGNVRDIIKDSSGGIRANVFPKEI